MKIFLIILLIIIILKNPNQIGELIMTMVLFILLFRLLYWLF
ncbi:hypothetical protein [Fusobacterium nucleatum]